MRVLISSPDFDNITRYLHSWSKQLADGFQQTHSITHIEGGKATKEHICGVIEKTKPDVILLNGHGADDKIGGHNNEIIIDSDNVSILNNSTVHALSCSTANKLGELAIDAGAKGYIGYDEKFVLVMRQGYLSRPCDDPTASLFMEPAMTAEKALLNKKTPIQAVEIAKKAYKRNILEALNSDVQSDHDQIVKYLYHDLIHLKAFNGSKKI